ncbi:MAG: LLM class flavin-dependent oxidoreductase [Actinomycetota bacterium]
MAEVWVSTWGHDVEELIANFQRFEAAGVHGVSFSDSQNLWFDTWVALTLAARETDRIKLGPIVTSPMTRHPAVTAGAAASANEVAEGRLMMGVGRGDSAHAYLGHGLTPFAQFEEWLLRVQSYLRGEEVEFDSRYAPTVPALDSLGYADAPTASKIQWLPTDRPKVPVMIATSGPRVLRLAATHTEGAVLGMGCNHERIAGAVELARTAASDAGNDDFTMMAIIPVVPHHEPDTALRIGKSIAQTMARWSVMDNSNRNMDPAKRAAAEQARQAYDMNRHGSGGQQAQATEEMARDYAVFGTPDECVAQLEDLAALGIDRFLIPSALRGGSEELRSTVQDLLLDEVVAALV